MIPSSRLVILVLCLGLGSIAGKTFIGRGPAVVHAQVGSISFVSVSGKGTGGTGNVQVTAPPSLQENDILIAGVMVSSSSTVTMSSEWTEITNQTNPSLYLFWHRYSGTNPDFLATISAGSQSPTMGIAVFRGCKRTGSPVNTTGGGSSGTDESIEITGLTPSVANCMLVMVAAAEDDNTISAIPSGSTTAFEDGAVNCFKNTLGTPDALLGLWYKAHTTGATGDLPATQSALDAWQSRMIALEPE